MSIRSKEDLDLWYDDIVARTEGLKPIVGLRVTCANGESIPIPYSGEFATISVEYADGSIGGCKLNSDFLINTLRLGINDWGFTPENGEPIVL